MSRADRMMAKATGHADGEKWTRFQVDLPPDQADILMRHYRRVMGVNANSATRQGLLRSALLLWWEREDPELPPDYETTATDVF